MAELTEAHAEWLAGGAGRLVQNIEQAVKGKPEIVKLAVVGLLSEGHLLIEDVPGTGKTTLARSIAESIGGSWKRIQFTPDLLPSDVTGAQIYNQAKMEFEFHPGAIFTNVLLADEINRASPKTQSALLEVMEERQHTADGETHPVPRPFTVVATQNPVEHDGTYRLPEAQLDRFLLKTSLGYLSVEGEMEVLEGSHVNQIKLSPCVSASDVQDLISVADRIHAAPSILRYIAELTAASRAHKSLRLGVSPRGGIALLRAAKTLAGMDGLPYVTPDHVKELIRPVFGHRLLLTPDAEFRQASVDEVIDELLLKVTPPSTRGI